MSALAVLTPSFRPDLASLLDLHQSVRRFTDGDVVHHVVVPDRDLPLFSRHAGERLQVHSIRSFLPASFLSTYVSSERLRRSALLAKLAKVQAVNARRPWPPIRGWILQQVAKLAVAAQLDAEVVLVVDSDVALIQQIGVGDLVRDGAVRLFRLPEGVTAGMPDHLAWHRTAHRLLGIQGPGELPLPDYISPLVAWDPVVVRRAQERIAAVAGQDWRSVVCAQRAFSECILYGTFIDVLGGERERSFTQDRSRCHTYWDTKPMTSAADVDSFLATLSGDELALHVQSVSGTDASLRRDAVLRAEQLVRVSG